MFSLVRRRLSRPPCHVEALGDVWQWVRDCYHAPADPYRRPRTTCDRQQNWQYWFSRPHCAVVTTSSATGARPEKPS
jgi:hypothetical protein